MEIKWVFTLVVLVAIGLVVFFHNFYRVERIRLEETTPITSFDLFEAKPLEGNSYRIGYENKISTSCFFQRLTFSDESSLISGMNKLEEKFKSFVSNKTYYSKKGVEGFEYICLGLESYSPASYCMLVKRGSYLIIGECPITQQGEKVFEKVVEWFIQRF